MGIIYWIQYTGEEEFEPMFYDEDKLAILSKPMKHGCVSGLGCGCGCGCETRQFLKNVGTGTARLGD